MPDLTTPPATPITPIPASKSRTLRLNFCAVVGAIIAVAPTIASYTLQLLGDPTWSRFIDTYVPPKLLAAIIPMAGLIVALRNNQLRRQTTAAIQGTPAGAQADQAIHTALNMPPGSDQGDLGAALAIINSGQGVSTKAGEVPTPVAAAALAGQKGAPT